MDDYYPVSTTELRKQGTRGVISTGAGVGLWVVNGILHIPVVGIILGGALAILGLLGLLGRDRTDKTTGAVLLVAGAAGLSSVLPFLRPISSFLFGVGGLALVGFGVFNLFKFIKGLKSRS
jgi:hypothetical protein